MKRFEVKLPLAIFLLSLAALSRVLPHPANFAPMTAMALFTGAVAYPMGKSLFTTFFIIWVSDFLVNNILYSEYFGKIVFYHEGFYFSYISYLIIFLLGRVFLRAFSFLKLALLTFMANLTFFAITNFGVFLTTNLYPKTMVGLGEAYLAAIPFWRNALLGDFFYTAFLFGLSYLASQVKWGEKFAKLPR